MTLGIALLGTGGIAHHAFVPAVHAVDAARLVAVLSRDKTRGAAFAQQHGIPRSMTISMPCCGARRWMR